MMPLARTFCVASRRRLLDRHATPLIVMKRAFATYPPHQVVGLPSLSPTMDSGSIANWNVKEGDSFTAGDVFCSVETDKATVDFEAQEDGVIAKILAQAGSGEIKVGDPIMVTVDNVADVGAFVAFSITKGETRPAAAASPPAPVAPSPQSQPSTATPSVAAHSAAMPSGGTNGRVVASPLAHMLARELGYDLSKIPGTGPGGRVIAADVKEYTPMAAVATPVAPQAPPVATPAPAQTAVAMSTPTVGMGYTDYPLSDAARYVAAQLQSSKRNVPHYYLTVDISCDELLKIRDKLNQSLPDDGKLGVYEFLLKAAALSMKAVPSANAAWMDSFVRIFDSVDINVVVGSGEELSTPVFKNMASKGLKAVAAELVSATSSDTPVGDLGTFTVINLGMYGIKSCAPIIREPQACALAIGALENRIFPNDNVDNEEIYKESVVFTATLSCDHRVVDGAVGAQWLAAFKSHVENPTTLLL